MPMRSQRLQIAISTAIFVMSASAFAHVGTVRHVRRTVIDEAGLAALTRDIRAEAFRDEKLGVLARTAGSSWFLVDQARALIALFEWRDDRLRALAMMGPLLLDRERMTTLLELFPDDRDAAQRLLR